LAGEGTQAGTVLTLGYHLVLRGWAVLEPRDADAGILRYNTPQARPGELR
jgi:hypothetical protein